MGIHQCVKENLYFYLRSIICMLFIEVTHSCNNLFAICYQRRFFFFKLLKATMKAVYSFLCPSVGGWGYCFNFGTFWNFVLMLVQYSAIDWKQNIFFLCIFIGLACSLISSVVQVLILTQWLLYYICRKALSKRCFLVYRAFTFSVLCMVASKIDKVYRWDGEGMFTM